jgi:hypothetical protein
MACSLLLWAGVPNAEFEIEPEERLHAKEHRDARTHHVGLRRFHL